MRQQIRLAVALLLMMAVTRLMARGPSKVIASKKTYNMQQRFTAAYAAVTAVTGPIATAGNTSDLAGFSQQAAPVKLTGYSGPTYGAPSSNSNADLFSWATGAEGTFNDLYNYITSDVAPAVNAIYDALQAAGVFT